MTKRLHLLSVSAALLLAVALSADAQPAKAAAADPEKALRQRVSDYWQTRMKEDLRAVQPFYEKAFRDKYARRPSRGTSVA